MFARSILRRSSQRQVGCSATSTVPAEHIAALNDSPQPHLVFGGVVGFLTLYFLFGKKDEQTVGGLSYWAGYLYLNRGVTRHVPPTTMGELKEKLGQE